MTQPDEDNSPSPHSRSNASGLRVRSQAGALFVPGLLVLFAVVYYASYARSGLNLGGEGGTNAVIALRLMAGQRPIVDTFLGYNVMWFIPLVFLFKIFGPHYLALRWFFFGICTLTGLLTYFTVKGYSRTTWFSAIPAVIVILIPGMIFRNYMPFLGMLNAFLLTRAFVINRSSLARSLEWMMASGAGLGFTFLFRIDLGIFHTIIFLGLAVLYPIGTGSDFWRRSGFAAFGVTIGLLLAALLHLPVLIDAKARGYDVAFVQQYTSWFKMIRAELVNQTGIIRQIKKPVELPAPEPAVKPTSTPLSTPEIDSHCEQLGTWAERGARTLVPVGNILGAKRWTENSFAICTYAPILISGMAVLVGSIGLLWALARKNLFAKERILYPLTVLGCSLALAPQFYFFRPDTPHLSEMMVPFLAACAIMIWGLVQFGTVGLRECRFPIWVGHASILLAALCFSFAVIYFSHAFPKESSGSIAAKKMASFDFKALNGINVKVRENEAKWMPKLRDAVLSHSRPNEFVLCLPYSPTINFMTDRPSPAHNLYADNSTSGSEFNCYFLSLMEKSSPSVVVVDQRRINKNAISSFRNWAPGPYKWLWDHYQFVGKYYQNEVFVRKDRATPGTSPEFIEASD